MARFDQETDSEKTEWRPALTKPGHADGKECTSEVETEVENSLHLQTTDPKQVADIRMTSAVGHDVAGLSSQYHHTL